MNAGDLKINAGKQATYLETSVGAACLQCPHGLSLERGCIGGLHEGFRAGHRGRLGRRLGHVRGRRDRLDRVGLGDQALVRGLTPRVVDGLGQGQDSGPVHPEHPGLALAPLLDPA